MNGTPEAASWLAPRGVDSALIRLLSAALDGDLVLWCHVEAGDQTLIVDVMDPIPEAQVVADRLRGTRVDSPAALTGYVARTGETLFLPTLELADHPIERFPDPWPEYLNAHPVFGLIAVPVPLDDTTTGVLVVARRSPGSPYTREHLALAEHCAGRLVGRATPAPDVPTAGRPAITRRLRSLKQPARAREILLGAALPLAITAAVAPFDENSKLRPAVLLLLGCVIAAVLGGFRAALLGAVISTLALWWSFTPPESSWLLNDAGNAVGVLLYLATVLGVVQLVLRLDDARSEERLERLLSDTLLNESPVAVAVLDEHLRFERVNRPMADLHDVAEADMLGRRPDDVHLLAGQLYQHLLAGVLSTGEPLVDVELSIERPEVATERHWRLSAETLDAPSGEAVGLIMSVLDITNEVIVRRRAEQLRRLSESLSSATDEHVVADDVCSFLVQAFRGRAAVALRPIRSGAVKVMAVVGFPEDVRARWLGSTLERPELAPLREAVESEQVVVLPTPATFAGRFPEADERRDDSWSAASCSMPIRDTTGVQARGVLHVGWVHSRPITHQSVTLFNTVSSLVSLALARIEATRTAHEDQFRRALDAMLDDVVILRGGDDGTEVSGFSVSYANGRDTAAARRVVGTMTEQCRSVVATGIPFQGDRLQYEHEDDDGNLIQGYWRVQIVPFGEGCLAIARDITDVVAAEEQAREAARQAEVERTSIELLQAAALPSALPRLAGLNVAAVYQPADPRQPVGGDWYDVFLLDDRRVAIVIADVAGHGRRAAAFMVQVRNVFRAVALEHAEPGDVLERANIVTRRLGDVATPFVTCCYAVLGLDDGVVRWAQAGHFSPMVVSRDGGALYLPERPGPPLAVFDGVEYATSSVRLSDGDRVVLFTDGVVERRGEHLDVGLARLAEAAQRHAGLAVGGFVEAVAAEVTDRFDDLALVCVDVGDR